MKGDGKTVVRAGGSVMYEQLGFNVFDNIANVLGLSQVPTGATIVVNGAHTPGTGNIQVATLNINGKSLDFLGSSLTTAFGGTGTTTVFPTSSLSVQCGDGLTISPGNVDPGPCNTEAIAPNFRTPYVDTWTLNVQRALTNNLSLEVAYVGTHGTKLLGFADINSCRPLVPDILLERLQAAVIPRLRVRPISEQAARPHSTPSFPTSRRLTSVAIATAPRV